MAQKNSSGASILKHSTIYAIGNISRQLVSFLMLPVYTHYLTPADYGVVGLISFAIAMFETLFGAKMVTALPKFYHDQQSDQGRRSVVSTTFVVTGLISSITVAALFMFRDVGSKILFGDERYGLVVGLCAIQMLTQAIEYYGLLYTRLLNRPIEFVSFNLLKLGVQLALNIWLVVSLRLGVLGIAISGVAATALFAVLLGIRTLAQTGLKFDVQLAKRMLAFSWPLWLSGLASLYTYSAGRYYIRIFDSLDSVGLNELASKFSGILLLLIWGPFSQYWQTEQFKILQMPDAPRIFRSVFQFLAFLLIWVSLGISIFSDSVIRIMSAPSFYPAAAAVPFMLLTVVLMNLTEFSNVSFVAKEKTLWLSLNMYVTAAIVTVFYLILTPMFGFVGAAGAICLAQGIQFVSVHRAARKHSSIRIPLRPLLQMLLVAGAGYVVANIVLAQSNLWLDVGFKALVFIATSIGLCLSLFSEQEYRDRLYSVLAGIPLPRRLRALSSRLPGWPAQRSN